MARPPDAAREQSMTESADNAITLDSPDVRRLINIAARWKLLSRLAVEVSAMSDAKWEPLLLRARDDTHRAVLQLSSVTHAPESDAADPEQVDGLSVTPVVFGPREADIIGELAGRALVASKLLRPLLGQLPENSTTWFDARKIVDRLDFDGRELLAYVRLINPVRASEILAQVE
jgi:hypothetical protein